MMKNESVFNFSNKLTSWEQTKSYYANWAKQYVENLKFENEVKVKNEAISNLIFSIEALAMDNEQLGKVIPLKEPYRNPEEFKRCSIEALPRTVKLINQYLCKSYI